MSILRKLLFLLPLLSINAQASMTIATIDWCPFICPSSMTKPGMLVEYTREIYGDVEIELNFEVYPWSRAIKMANEGKVDALLAPARNEAPLLVFPDTEIGIQRFCFFSRADDPWQYNNPASLNARTIIHPKNTLPDLFKSNEHKAVFITYPYNNAYMPTSTDILLKARVDSFMMTYASVKYFLNQKQLVNKIHLSGCVTEQKLFLAFTPNSKKQKKIKKLMVHFERNVARLSKQRFFEKLVKKYQVQ
jgi:polar amino acid transport system substrate-binding protein